MMDSPHIKKETLFHTAFDAVQYVNFREITR